MILLLSYPTVLDGEAAKLRKLEDERRQLLDQSDIAPTRSPTKLLTDAETEWKKVVSNLGDLNKVAKAHEMEEARQVLRGIIGEVTIVEEDDHILAYPMISKNAMYKGGAENAAPDLYLDPKVLK